MSDDDRLRMTLAFDTYDGAFRLTHHDDRDFITIDKHEKVTVIEKEDDVEYERLKDGVTTLTVPFDRLSQLIEALTQLREHIDPGANGGAP